MNGMCNLKNVVYQATIFPKKNVKDEKLYIGISSWELEKSKNFIQTFLEIEI